jgi:LAO/AO transport system kinase
MTYSGYYKTGIREIWDMVYEYVAFTTENGFFDLRRHSQSKYWMYESINEQLKNHFYRSPEIAAQLEIKEKQVLHSEVSSFMAAKEMLDLYFRR